MIDSFRIKEALRSIGKENQVYDHIFQNYENLERQKEKLEKKLEGAMRRIHELMEQKQSATLALQGEIEERDGRIEQLLKEIQDLKKEIDRLKQVMSTMVPRDSKKDEEMKRKMQELRDEMEQKLRDKDEQWTKQMRKVEDEMVDLKTKATSLQAKHDAELKRQKSLSDEEMQKLHRQLAAIKEELETKKQEIVDLKNKPGDYDGLNKSKLEIVGRKKGWNLKMIQYLVRDEDIDIDDIRNKLQNCLAENQELRKELEKAKSSGGGAGEARALVGSGGGGGDSEKLMLELEQLRARYAQLESSLQAERQEVSRLRDENAEMAKKLRHSEGDLQLVEQLKQENQQMKVAMEEMRLRLAKLEQLARKNGAGKEFKAMMEEVGLSEQMQNWLLQNVFERLYRDAMARHKRLEDRFLKAQEALRQEQAKMEEILHLKRSSLKQGSSCPGFHIKAPQEMHNVLMTWASVTHPDDGDTVKNARVRVHKLLAERPERSATAQSVPFDNRNWAQYQPPSGPRTDPSSFSKVNLNGKGLPAVLDQKPQRLVPLRHKVRKGHTSSASALPATPLHSSSAPSVWQNFVPDNPLSFETRFKDPPKALPDRAHSALPMAR